MLVSCGIEFARLEEAKREILSQLSICREGKFEDWELEAARRTLVTTLRSLPDHQGRLEDFWLGQTVAGLVYDPETLAQCLERIGREEIVAAGRDIRLDTVYFLKGKGET